MASYAVRLMSRAVRDLDEIYGYIAHSLLEPVAALGIVDDIERAILSLEEMPYRCPERRMGPFADKGYRQLLVGNYTIVYRIDETQGQVLVVTIRYSMSEF